MYKIKKVGVVVLLRLFELFDLRACSTHVHVRKELEPVAYPLSSTI